MTLNYLFGPLANAVVAFFAGREVGVILHGMMPCLVLVGGTGGEPLVEVGREDVRLVPHLGQAFKLAEL